MKFATCALAALVAAATLAPAASASAIPDGKIAVVRVTSIDGLAAVNGPVSESRSEVFSYDGTDYRIDRSALGSLDDVQTLVLIDRRKDEASGGKFVQTFSQEVRPVKGASFTSGDLPGKSLSFQVAVIAGNLRLTGSGDQILATGGDNGPYHIWKVTGVDLVSKDAIELQ